MKKNIASKFYFSHDYNARNDSKVLKLRAKYGWEGYGIYFGILEVMAEETDSYLSRVAIAELSLSLGGIDCNKLAEIVDFCIATELFEKNDKGYTSFRMQQHKKLRKSFIESGRKGAINRWKNANRVAITPPNGDPNAKERKGKENNNTKVLLGNDAETKKNIYIECLLNEFEKVFGYPPTDKKPRFVAQAFRANINKFLKVFNPEITFDRFERVTKAYFDWLSGQDYSGNIQNLDLVKRKFVIWATPQVKKTEKGQNANS